MAGIGRAQAQAPRGGGDFIAAYFFLHLHGDGVGGKGQRIRIADLAAIFAGVIFWRPAIDCNRLVHERGVRADTRFQTR